MASNVSTSNVIDIIVTPVDDDTNATEPSGNANSDTTTTEGTTAPTQFSTEVANNNASPEFCSLETHGCQCQCEAPLTPSCPTEGPAVTLNLLVWELNCERLSRRTAEFKARTGINVNIDCVGVPLTRDQFHAEILSDARTQTGLHDGYTLGPHLYGDLDLLDGLYDLTSLVRSGTIGSMADFELNWSDIFLFARENGAVYDRKIVGIPIDGDVHSLYYRKDLFEKYNKTPPATWEEYTELAKFFHKRLEPLPNDPSTEHEIVGSCVGKLERTEFWVFLVLSSMTQYAGTKSGAFFDPRIGKGMEPLLGEAFVKTLQYMEEQYAWGAEDEYTGDFKTINLAMMNQGRCAMTFNWGDAYTEANKAPPTSLIAGYLGTAPTPGSRFYLDRDSQMLEPCTEEICSCGNSYFEGHENDSCINSAPYAAFTGWAGACSNYTAAPQKRACAEFFGYISSAETSVGDTIPNVTVGAPVITVDPFRISQTVLSDWTSRGLPEQSTRVYLETIEAQLSDTNVVLDMRIPRSADFQSEMNSAFRDHLLKVKQKRDAGLEGEDLLLTEEERWETEREIRRRWKWIINSYDSTNSPPLLEAYQRNLGVYQAPSGSVGQIGIGPIIGITAAIVAVVVGAAFFVIRERNRKNDDIWQIKKSEIKFEDPPVIVGRGRFGLVLLAEYRGTDVAVKRVLPQRTKPGATRGGLGNHSADFDGWFRGDLEAANRAGAATKDNRQQDGPTEASKSGRDHVGSASGGNEKTIRQLKKDFRREMRLLSRLRHPCITTAVGAVINSKEEPMLVMEYMSHGSLYDILHNETMVLEGPMLLGMLCDICQGVRFLHACDPPVIHCDLKASNVLVDSKFRAKVADFGLSARARAGAIGSPFWMAPELLIGKTSNTMESDVYAFGVLLYEVFSRKEPYDGEDPVEVLKLVCDTTVNKRPPLPKDCPPQIHSVMSDCLVASPEERPSFEELDKRLRRVDAKEVETKNNAAMDQLSLSDIFPMHIAEALRQGKPVEAEHKEVVTIFFSDIVGFTDLSAVLEPRKVADLLGRLYDQLDKLAHKHDVFKVETVGDAYMAVTNLVKPQPNDHVKRIAEFAADAIDAANRTYIDSSDPNRGMIQLRVGFHSGPVVADVVGSLNPRYCLFGDTVNTSSRLESHSEANRIHCSEASAILLQQQKPGISMTSRGMVNVKGKGLMHTFWVNHEVGTSDLVPESANS